ncbi:MAG: type II toxin-antitoxin system RelE/ParE family toxin [Acidobacteria bacterium]|nr:type II toxin-antitoxin system RelE/ParE family toxin [Acidobacteriota bacterium]
MWEVRYQRQAARRLLRMPRDVAHRIRGRIDTIAADPYADHPNATRLSGRDGDFRLRVGDWRVVYSLEPERRVMLVAVIDQRGQVYR